MAKNTFPLTSDKNETQHAVINKNEDKIPGILVPIGEPEPENEGARSKAEEWPEPGPEWKEAYEKWGLAWEIHIYGFSACFFAVFVYASYYVVVNIAEGLRHKYLSVSLNMMMVICGFSRAFILALDPYHQGTEIDAPVVFMRILWSLTDPCLTAADSLVILSLLETYKLSIAPQRFQRPSSIVPVIIFHFSFVLISDLVVSEFVDTKAMLLFCQVFFTTWCTTLGIAYFLIGYKLDKLLFKSGAADGVPQEGRWYIYLIHASGVSNIVTSAVYIYSAAGVFGVYSDVQFVDAWPWWSLQTGMRVTELVAAVLVFTVSAKRAQPTQDISGIDELDADAEVPPPRKRKQSMFTALRSNRTDQSNIAKNSVQGCSGIQDDPCTDNQEFEQQEENQVERKNSMFTTLGELVNITEQENNESVK